MNLRESGVLLILIGIGLFIFGFMLLLDKALMICGNILIFCGIGVLSKTNLLNLFTLEKLQGTALLIIGFVFLLFGIAFFGFFLEICGLVILLRTSIPSFRSIIRGFIFGKSLKSTKFK